MNVVYISTVTIAYLASSNAAFPNFFGQGTLLILTLSGGTPT